VHYLDHEIISHELVKSKDLSRIYKMYFEEVVHSIESRLFDVIGHFDLVSRFLNERRSEPKSVDYWGGVNTVLEEIIEEKIHLEANSKGMRETYKDTMPSEEIVKEFIRNGGTLISIGSDAHSVQEIGNGIKEVMDLLQNCDGDKLRLPFLRG
jgi:histidinol-phosphatase (PHP family)